MPDEILVQFAELMDYRAVRSLACTCHKLRNVVGDDMMVVCRSQKSIYICSIVCASMVVYMYFQECE